MKPSKIIAPIPISEIYPHPDNPRKNIGDITEMVESIKKNGVMQNLTVIPGHFTEDKELVDGGYTLVIGHRRHAAAKEAGIKELPCRIIKEMSYKEQVSTMLEENMQRTDLTIYEQAQGFQMMLDLGETVDSISEKTGFSKTTVYHRVNLAKLDQNLLKEKETNDSYQLTLKDLYELEKIADVETRNRILKESYNSNQISWRANEAAREEVRSKNEKKVVELLEAQGVKKAPKGSNYWDPKWDINKRIDLDKDAPEKITLKNKNQKFYLSTGGTMYVLQEAKKEEKKKTTEEIRREELEKNKNKIKSRIKELGKTKRRFVTDLVNGEIGEVKCDVKKLWDVLVLTNAYISQSNLRKFFTGKADWDCSREEKEAADQKIKELGMTHQMLMVMEIAMDNAGDLYDYFGCYREETGKKLLAGFEILEELGWTFEDEEDKAILDGSSELYKKEE